MYLCSEETVVSSRVQCLGSTQDTIVNGLGREEEPTKGICAMLKAQALQQLSRASPRSAVHCSLLLCGEQLSTLQGQLLGRQGDGAGGKGEGRPPAPPHGRFVRPPDQRSRRLGRIVSHSIGSSGIQAGKVMARVARLPN